MKLVVFYLRVVSTEVGLLRADHFDRRSKEVTAKRLVAQLAKLGFDAALTPLPQAA